MKASLVEHRVASTLILGVSVWVAYISFTGEPAEAFLFPRIIAVALLALAVWNFVRAFAGLAKVGEGVSLDQAKTIAPGIVIILIYVFVLAKLLGFYLASTLTFVVLYAIYDPAPHVEIKSWIKRLGIVLLFMAVIYGLFSQTLQVQTPRGIFL